MASGILDFGVTLGSRICILFINLGIQSCLAWILGPSGRGSYAVCMVFATILSLVFIIGCDVASIYFVASKKFDISEGIIYSLLYGGIGSALAILVGIIIIHLPLSFLSKATFLTFCLSLISIPFSLFSFIFLQLLTAVQQFYWFAFITVGSILTQLILTLLFIWILSWNVSGAILAIIINGALTIIITLIFLHRKYRLRWIVPELHKLKEMFHYGVRYYVGKISNTVNFQVGTIILAFLATNEEIGLFAVAASLTAGAMMIPDTLTTILIPRVAIDKTGQHELIAKCARLTGLFCGIILLFLVVFAKSVVSTLFSSEFLAAVPLIQILAVGVLIRCLGKVFVPYLLGTNHPGVASISVGVGTCTNLLILWLLLPIMGIIGAAIGMMGSYIISSIILIISFNRLSGLSLFKIFQYKRSDLMVLFNHINNFYGKINFARKHTHV